MKGTIRNRRSYTELSKIPDRRSRFEYLRIDGSVGRETFGFNRFLNQAFYTSSRWRAVREKVILRDNACDMGIELDEIAGMVVVHHLNPITQDEVENDDPALYDPENLVSVSELTHKAIHYSNYQMLQMSSLAERRPNDMAPWKK